MAWVQRAATVALVVAFAVPLLILWAAGMVGRPE